ncbi:MFS transporter [Nocardioides mangrovicus]|uniref:MFS transporter n=1 Tax=Nocardioides mangrovicus TaxID=2478913 RepID=A0A3L8P0J4_9ACTN|nr:MFS transporter [Nocardioides mangrovicus]RLV48531.1 MFS transporter [Nocardioides mangrovicus]
MHPTPSQDPPPRTQLRAATIGGAFGFFVDMYDVYLPTIALAPALTFFVPADVPASTSSLIAALVFVATLVGRPLGSVVFGRFADRVGRRRVTLWSVAGCGVTTLLIAVLPGYDSWGLGAVWVLIALRLVDGIFLGGEYTGAIPLAMESAGNHRRGLYGGLVSIGFPLAYCAISLLTFVTLHLAPAGGPDSDYVRWGWRIPFLVGAALSVVFLVFYARTVKESPVWSVAAKRENPLRTVVLGPSRRAFGQVFVLMTGVWFASNMASGLLPASLASQTTLSATEITGVLVLAQFVHAGCFPLFGLLVDRIGRRPFFLACGFGVGVVCAACFAYLAGGHRSGLVPVFVLTLVIRVSGASMFAVTPSYLCERFPAAVRGSGFGLGYSTPLLVTAGYAYYQDWLGHLMPAPWTPVVLLVLGGALIALGAAMGPETKDVDFAVDVAPTTERTAA